MTEHLWLRLVKAKNELEPVQSKYRVVFEDPNTPEEPIKILSPDPNWLAAALKGNILPPIEAYLQDKKVEAEWTRDNPGEEFSWKKAGGATHPYVEPTGPMTEEEAIEYLIQKDIPTHIWAHKYNRPMLKIVPVELVPTDRSYRNAWKLAA